MRHSRRMEYPFLESFKPSIHPSESTRLHDRSRAATRRVFPHVISHEACVRFSEDAAFHDPSRTEIHTRPHQIYKQQKNHSQYNAIQAVKATSHAEKPSNISSQTKHRIRNVQTLECISGFLGNTQISLVSTKLFTRYT